MCPATFLDHFIPFDTWVPSRLLCHSKVLIDVIPDDLQNFVLPADFTKYRDKDY